MPSSMTMPLMGKLYEKYKSASMKLELWLYSTESLIYIGLGGMVSILVVLAFGIVKLLSS